MEEETLHLKAAQKLMRTSNYAGIVPNSKTSKKKNAVRDRPKCREGIYNHKDSRFREAVADPSLCIPLARVT